MSINSLRPSDAYMHQFIIPSSVQLMAFQLFSTMSLCEHVLVYGYLCPWKRISVKNESKYKYFQWRIWICDWKTTESFDWKLTVSFREGEIIENSLIAYPWHVSVNVFTLPVWWEPLPWASVHWLVQCTLECHWLTQCTLGYHWATQRILAGCTGTPLEKLIWNSPTLECHWRNLVESGPHWDATGETLTFAGYTGTPLEGLWHPTHAPTHIVKHAE